MLLCQFLYGYNMVLSILVLVFLTIAFLLLHLLITPYLQSSILFLLLFYCRIFSFAFLVIFQRYFLLLHALPLNLLYRRFSSRYFLFQKYFPVFLFHQLVKLLLFRKS